jgi:hypothetical protein
MLMVKMIAVVAATLPILTATTARAMDKGDWSLDINGASWHSHRRYNENGDIRKFNQTNLGVGGSYAWSDHVDLKLGFFDNSYEQNSFYAGAYLHKDFYSGDWAVSPGIALLLVSGYDDTPEDAPTVAPIPLFGVAFGHRALKLNVGYVPFGEVDFATVQLQVVPKHW